MNAPTHHASSNAVEAQFLAPETHQRSVLAEQDAGDDEFDFEFDLNADRVIGHEACADSEHDKALQAAGFYDEMAALDRAGLIF